MSEPPKHIVELAIEVAGLSPCRSKRGSVIFAAGDVIAHGHNHKPSGFECDGSAACKATCRAEAVHAEQVALLQAGHAARGAEMLHVKAVDGQLVPSGGPSCVQCSKLGLYAGVAGIWLYHEQGWRWYDAAEWHRLSLAATRPCPTCAVLREALEKITQRKFPIQNGPDIPWAVIVPFEKQALRQHDGQTLERLAERGGLSVCEVLSIIKGNGDYFDYWERGRVYDKAKLPDYIRELQAIVDGDDHSALRERAERAEAALKEAREEREKAQASAEASHGVYVIARARYEKAEASLTSYTEAAHQIAKFAQHKPECEGRRVRCTYCERQFIHDQCNGFDIACTCGLAEAILALGTKHDAAPSGETPEPQP